MGWKYKKIDIFEAVEIVKASPNEFVTQDVKIRNCVRAEDASYAVRQLLRALWMARARNADLMSCKEFYNEYKREHPYSRWNDVRSAYSYATSFTNWSRWFQYISRTCLAKAKEFELWNFLKSVQ